MFKKIEIENFQSHKNTIIEFDKNITSLCGESDNGKTAVIRAIKWLVENRPLGTDMLNSFWNKDFDAPMRVRIYTEKGWVERIRSNKKNNYVICKNNEKPTEFSAVGTNVPSEVTEFLKVSDINFQYQLDSPYLLSMKAGEASRYLNNIIHLDSIDDILSVADSDKRQVNSEIKVVENDIKVIENRLKDYEWVDKALQIKVRIEKYDERINNLSSAYEALQSDVSNYEGINIIDVSKQEELIKKIEEIEIPDCSEFEDEIESYENFENKIIDVSKQDELIKKIEEIDIPDCSELESEIKSYETLTEQILKLKIDEDELLKSLPKVCPVCGGELKGELACF